MDKLGGLEAVIKELEDIESDIRTTSAWVLGKASQNNAIVQNQVSCYFLLVYLVRDIWIEDPCTNRKFRFCYLLDWKNYCCIGKLRTKSNFFWLKIPLIVENAINFTYQLLNLGQ